ncbi:MAG TPA: flagellar basal body-associated FliL family protein [Novosphingobium sp.]|nr:flagellar basal body-associated FliL family protein [Novosphingobium sp.]
MSDKPDKDAKPKGGKGLLVKAVLGIVLLGAGGGGVFGLMAAGILPGGSHAAKEDNNPKLVRKGEKDPFAPPPAADKDKGAPADVDGEGGSEYRVSYYSFTEEFTSNLKNSESLVQLSLACSTRRDGRVLMWLKKHELAIRSAMLTVIADTPEEEVYTVEGKDRLQQRLTAAINKVLTETEGFGGVDAVYFRAFIIQ